MTFEIRFLETVPVALRDEVRHALAEALGASESDVTWVIADGEGRVEGDGSASDAEQALATLEVDGVVTEVEAGDEPEDVSSLIGAILDEPEVRRSPLPPPLPEPHRIEPSGVADEPYARFWSLLPALVLAASAAVGLWALSDRSGDEDDRAAQRATLSTAPSDPTLIDRVVRDSVGSSAAIDGKTLVAYRDGAGVSYAVVRDGRVIAALDRRFPVQASGLELTKVGDESVALFTAQDSVWATQYVWDYESGELDSRGDRRGSTERRFSADLEPGTAVADALGYRPPGDDATVEEWAAFVLGREPIRIASDGFGVRGRFAALHGTVADGVELVLFENGRVIARLQRRLSDSTRFRALDLTATGGVSGVRFKAEDGLWTSAYFWDPEEQRLYWRSFNRFTGESREADGIPPTVREQLSYAN